MAYANVSAPRFVYPWQMQFGSGVATYIVAANDSNNKQKADYVCDGTNDEVEIQQAIDALPSTGGLIWLLEGTYNISNTITISKNNTMITGGGHTTVINIMSNVPDPAYPFYATNVNDITIQNLKIDGNKDATSVNVYGIYFNGVSRGKIMNCYIMDMGNHGMWIYNSPDMLISGNIVETCDGYGIYLRTDSDRCFVTENRVYNTGEYGIILDSCDHCAISDNYDEGSGQSGSNGYGIYLANADNNSVTANKLINDGSYGILLNGGNYCSVTSNYVYSSGSHGIYLTNTSTNNTVGDNTVEDATNYGIYILTNSTDNAIVGNTVRSNLSGIVLNESNNNTITGNTTMENSENGIYIYEAEYNTTSSNISRRNTKHGIYVVGGEDNVVTGNLCQDNDLGNTSTYDGIRLYQSDRCVVTSNRCLDNDRYEISISTGTNKALVAVNVVIGTDHTDTIFDQGTDSQVFDNIET